MGPAPSTRKIDDRLLADIHRRASDVDKCARWEELARQAGYCARPVRLRGHIEETETQTGSSTVTYSTRHEPDGVLLKACGSRRETVCPPCSYTYKRDAFVLIEAGLTGGKGVPESVAEHPQVFATFTAPGFGAVHSAHGASICNPGNPEETCPHGRKRTCGEVHEASDEVVGTALCSDCYGYEETVAFNATVSELYRRTMIYARRELGALVGMSVRETERTIRLSYAKVIEFQKRGCVHVHALIRVDGIDKEDRNEIVAPKRLVGSGSLLLALRLAAVKVSAPLPVGGEAGGSGRVRWGSQVDVKVVSSGAKHTPALVSRYLAKYSVKSTESTGALDHRLHAGDTERLQLNDHTRRLVEACWEMGDRDGWKELNLRSWSHTLGWRSHFMTKSRRWSTTFKAIRAERQEFVLGKMRERAEDAEEPVAEIVQMKHLVFDGMGYTTRGDAQLARNRAEQKIEERRERYEARVAA